MSGRARRVPDRARDMLEAIGNAHADIGDLGKEQFLADGKTQRAVIESIIVIGEAANQLSESFRGRYPDIDWRGIIGMRNRLVHGYFDVDLEVVWSVVKVDLPVLISQLEEAGQIEGYAP